MSGAGFAGQGGSFPEEPDYVLIRQARQGNTAAFEKLASSYDQAILGFLLALTSSEKYALDLCHATMLAAYREMPAPTTCSIYIWLHRLAAAQWLAWAKETHARDRASPGAAPQACAHALHELSPRERLVFTLKACRRLTLRTVAQILEESEDTLGRTFTRAVCKLRLAMQDSRRPGDPPA